MPGINAGAVSLIVRADDRGFNAATRRAIGAVRAQDAAMRRAQRTARVLRARFQALARSVLSLRGAFALAAGGGAIGFFIRSSTRLGANLIETSQRLGLTVESLQTLRAVFEADGVAIETFDRSFERFNQAIGEAGQGIGEYVQTFEQLGIEVRDGSGAVRSSRELFDEVTNAVQRLDRATQTQVLRDLFGRAGGGLIPVLLRGTEDLRRQEEHFARTLDLVSTEEAAKLKALEQTFTDLGNVIRNNLASVVAESTYELRQLADALSSGVGPALRNTAQFVSAVRRSWDQLLLVLAGTGLALFTARIISLAGQLRLLWTGFQAGSVALGALTGGLSGLIGPIGLVTAAFITLYNLMKDNPIEDFTRGLEQAGEVGLAETEARISELRDVIERTRNSIETLEELSANAFGRAGEAVGLQLASQRRQLTEQEAALQSLIEHWDQLAISRRLALQFEASQEAAAAAQEAAPTPLSEILDSQELGQSLQSLRRYISEVNRAQFEQSLLNLETEKAIPILEELQRLADIERPRVGAAPEVPDLRSDLRRPERINPLAELRSELAQITAERREQNEIAIEELTLSGEALDAARARREVEAQRASDLRELDQVIERVADRERREGTSGAAAVLRREREALAEADLSEQTAGLAAELKRGRVERENAERLIARTRERERIIRRASNTLVRGFEDAILRARSLADVFKSIGEEIVRTILRLLVLETIANLITSALGNVFGSFGGGGRSSGGSSVGGGAVGAGSAIPRSGATFDLNGASLVPTASRGLGSLGGNISPSGIVNNVSVNINSTDGPGVRLALAESLPALQETITEAAVGRIRNDFTRSSPTRRLAG